MEGMKSMFKNNPLLYILLVSVLGFSGGKVIYFDENDYKHKIDSLNIEMKETKRDILYLTKDLKEAEKRNSDSMKDIKSEMKSLIESHNNFKDEIKNIIINMEINKTKKR